MEVDAANRYRSRILREMKANRDNPFNSPPSSTGSHGTVSPTLSSVFSDPDGESTRRLNEDIARITAPRNMPVNWEAAHRKWPDFFSAPRSRSVPALDDTDTRPLSAESKENKPLSFAAKFTTDDSTQETWMGSNRTRAEMQPRADTESDLSILSKSPARVLSNPALKMNRNRSPLAKVHTRVASDSIKEKQHNSRETLSDALERLRNASQTPKSNQQDFVHDRPSPQMSSAKSSLTAVPPSLVNEMHNETHTGTNLPSFFMPDVSHLGDFVTGTLRFSGSMQNGVPVFVKNGKVHDRADKSYNANHAEVDAFELPEDEEKIFVSMDMIREEIISLQEHYDKVQEYAISLQEQVDQLEAELKSHKNFGSNFSSNRANDQLMTQKTQLEIEVATLQARLEQVSRKTSINEIENDALSQERDRAVRKLQEACEDINKLTRKLNIKQKELETTHRQLDSTEQIRQENDTLRRDFTSMKHGRDALVIENTSLETANKALRDENESLKHEANSLRSDGNKTRYDQTSLITENRSLRQSNKALMGETEDLRENLDGVQHELDAARELVETLRQEIQSFEQEKTSLREDNESLVRHNEKYFNENKVLRRENSGFERSVHDLHDENLKLKEEVEFLKQQLDHCRPIPKEDFTAQIDEETEENMTSAFFVPDITINTNETNPIEATETRELQDITQSGRQTTIPNVTEDETRNTTKQETTSHTQTHEAQQKSHGKTKSTSKSFGHSQRVAFSIPEKSQKNSSNMANQGSKRRTVLKSRHIVSKDSLVPRVDQLDENDDTTGVQSLNDDTTQDYSMQLDLTPKTRKDSRARGLKQATQELTSHSQRSRSSHKHTVMSEMTIESVRTADRDTCPVLSTDARRVLDDLCEHECRNCTVCSRIASHRGVISSADFAAGKKRVTVPRPVPVTDRDLSVEDPTMRPANSPGHALAMVIKGLEDEAHHLQLELTRIQAQYSIRDKALGRRERLSLAEMIRTMLKRLEAKNDQIYSLYDVLEGQKAAGQAMSEEEIEMTVLNITGMTVRDVTNGSEQLTWEGIPEL